VSNPARPAQPKSAPSLRLNPWPTKPWPSCDYSLVAEAPTQAAPAAPKITDAPEASAADSDQGQTSSNTMTKETQAKKCALKSNAQVINGQETTLKQSAD